MIVESTGDSPTSVTDEAGYDDTTAGSLTDVFDADPLNIAANSIGGPCRRQDGYYWRWRKR